MLRKEFETLEMRSGEGVTEYLSRVMTVANKMRTYGEDMKDVKVVEKILHSLTEKYNYVVCSIEESKDIDALSVDELQSSLIVHEQKFHRRKGEEQALKVAYEGGRGRGSTAYRGRGRGRAFNTATVQCYRCQRLGHFQWECPSGSLSSNYAKLDDKEDMLLMASVERHSARRENWQNKGTGYAEFDDEEEMLLMAYVEKHKVRREDAWFLDSGCSNHMSGHQAIFCDFNEVFRTFVKLGDNTRIRVMGKGSVKLLLNGIKHTISEVYYVPDLRNNLLSIGQFQERGLEILFKDGKCRVFHPKRGLIFHTSMSINRMFILFPDS